MNRYLLTLMASLMATIIFAQSPSRKSVVLDYFGKTAKVSTTYRDMIRAAVLTSLTNSGRLNLIDATNTTALQVSESASKSDVAPTVDNIRQTAMKESGGNVLITGNVTDIDATREKDNEGKIYYKGVVKFSLNIIDLITGNSIGAKDINYSDITARSGKTREEAISKTINYIPSSIKNFINTHFKLQTKIIQINEEKKGKVTQVFINAGSAVGITKSQTFLMYVISDVAGIERKEEIGRLTVVSVEGDELTLCKVSKPNTRIKELLNSGEEIIVVTDRTRVGTSIWETMTTM